MRPLSKIVPEIITGSRMPCSSKYLSMANRHAFMIRVSNDVSGSRMSTPARDQAVDLLGVGGDHLVEGHVATAGVVDVGCPSRAVLLVGPMLPATNRGLSGVRAGELVGRAAGELDGRAVQLDDVVLEAELRQRHGVAVERVGLDDVGAGLEVGAVDLLDHLRAGSGRGPRCSS